VIQKMSDPFKNDEFNERSSGWHYSLGWGDRDESVAPYVPTPPNVVHRMLELSNAGPGDVLYDLGCGDGRILFTAVEEFNVDLAVGYELNSNMIDAIREKISDKNLEDRIHVISKNFFEGNFAPANIVTVYLTTTGNSRLKPKFKDELKPGARIVSHDFPIYEWKTFKEDGEYYTLGSHKIYLYSIPECYSEKKKEESTPTKEEDRWNRIKRLFDRLERG